MELAGKIIKKILVAAVFLMAALLALRFGLEKIYPKDMRTLLPTGEIREAYAETGGNLPAKTQEIRVKYEDNNTGLFFADHLLVVPKTGSVQVTLRWNRSTLSRLEEKYGEAFDPTAESPFTYRIFCAREGGEETVLSGQTEITGDSYLPCASKKDKMAMYRYERLAFEGVELEGVFWIRIEIYLAGSDTCEGDIVIYEDHEDYNEFEDLLVKGSELS